MCILAENEMSQSTCEGIFIKKKTHTHTKKDSTVQCVPEHYDAARDLPAIIEQDVHLDGSVQLSACSAHS